jgi:periplasmic protein TonB
LKNVCRINKAIKIFFVRFLYKGLFNQIKMNFMEPKKNPEHDLGKKEKVFFQIGLIFALSVTLLAFEWTIYDRNFTSGFNTNLVVHEEDILIPITPPPIPLPPPPPPKPIVIDIVKDDAVIDEKDVRDVMIDDLSDFVYYDEMPEEIVIPKPEIFTSVQEMPTMKGCEIYTTKEEKEQCTYLKMQKHIIDNLKYPKLAIEHGIKGKVFVQFVVMENGSIEQVEVLGGIGGGCDEEAVRVIKSMPNWNAGKQRDNVVKVSYIVPIKFDSK